MSNTDYTIGSLKHVCFLILFFSIAIFALAQTRITGRVTADGKPVAGATVSVKGTATATQTDNNGNFAISASPNSTLEISAIGFTGIEVKVNNRTTVDAALQTSSAQMEQVVVVGYGTQRRRDITGSVSSVNAAQIEKVPVTTLDQAIQGRAAGVQVINNDASPGGNVSVLVRGIGSIAPGGNNPLYVIDGYPTTGGINNINPNDIASIDILKDASSTAIYGMRAANGVIIITTKRGLKNKVQVSLDAYNAVQTRPKEYDLLNAQEFATLSNEVEAADSTHTYHGMPIWHTPNQLNTVDWQNALYRKGLTQNYTIGIRGGSDKVQTAMSFGYYDQKGIILASFFKRFSLNLNLDYQATGWLKSSTSVKYSYQNANNPLGGGTFGLLQLAFNPPTLDSGNRLTNQIKDGNGNYGFYNPLNPNVNKFNNPIYTVETNQYQNVTNYVLASSSLEATIYAGLKIKTNAGVNTSNFSGSFFQPSDNRAALQYPGSVTTPANYHQNVNRTFEWLWENTLSYDKTFGLHSINFVGGISAQKFTWNGMGGGGIPPNNVTRDLASVTNLTLDQNTPGTNTGNGQNINTLASQFARLNYQLADKYSLQAIIRRDGSSKFDVDHTYGIFPSVSVAWRVKNESFLKDVVWLYDLKLRGGYGEVGNETPIALYQYSALYTGNFPSNVNGGGNDNLGYPFDKIYQNGIGPVQAANPKLKWETDKQTDVGLDAAFLHGALTFTADWFNRNSGDFLLKLRAPAQSGFNFFTRNVGTMNNKGIELAANYRGNSGRDFQYGIGLTWSRIKNKLTSITNGTNFIANFGGLVLNGFQGWDEYSRSYIGLPVGEFFGYKAIGIYQSQQQINDLNTRAPGGIYRPGTVARPGDRIFADISGPNGKPDGIVNADDRVAIGNPQAKFFGGLNLDGTYKAWDINLYFYSVYGNKLLNYVESNLESFAKRGSEGADNVSRAYYLNHWTPTNHSNRYARALPNGGDNSSLNNVPSDVWIEDGSFLKLKNLSIGYTLPASLLNRFSISRVRIYVSSQNLFTLTKYTGLDPEIGMTGANATQNGVDNGTYPSSRYFTFGLNVSF